MDDIISFYDTFVIIDETNGAYFTKNDKPVLATGRTYTYQVLIKSSSKYYGYIQSSGIFIDLVSA